MSRTFKIFMVVTHVLYVIAVVVIAIKASLAGAVVMALIGIWSGLPLLREWVRP